MKKKLSEMTLFELAFMCHKQDSCNTCPLYCHRHSGCKVAHFTPVVSVVKFGDDIIDVDLSIPPSPVRETITQAVREEFFEDR